MYRMASYISGTRDGQDWPKPGELVDLPEAEARDMLAANLIVPADEDQSGGGGDQQPTVEVAVAPAPETAAIDTRPGRAGRKGKRV